MYVLDKIILKYFFLLFYKKDDNTKLRSNVVALIEDNNRLHEEIRSTFVSDMLRLINVDDGQSMTDKEVQLFNRNIEYKSFCFSSHKSLIFIRKKCVIWKSNLKMRSIYIYQINNMIGISFNFREKLSMYETVWQAPNDLMNCLKCGALLPFGQHTTEHNEKFADIIT